MCHQVNFLCPSCNASVFSVPPQIIRCRRRTKGCKKVNLVDAVLPREHRDDFYCENEDCCLSRQMEDEQEKHLKGLVSHLFPRASEVPSTPPPTMPNDESVNEPSVNETFVDEPSVNESSEAVATASADQEVAADSDRRGLLKYSKSQEDLITQLHDQGKTWKQIQEGYFPDRAAGALAAKFSYMKNRQKSK